MLLLLGQSHAGGDGAVEDEANRCILAFNGRFSRRGAVTTYNLSNCEDYFSRGRHP